MKKSTIFNYAVVLFMLIVQNAMAQQSNLLLQDNNFSYTDPKTPGLPPIFGSNLWELKFVTNDQIAFKTGTDQVLRLTPTGVFADKPFYGTAVNVSSISNSGDYTGNGNVILQGNNTGAFERLYIPNGFAKTKGYIVNSASTDKSDWDAPWYGISQGGASTVGLAAGNIAKPVVVQGFYGIAFRTSNGKMTMDSKGRITMGLDDAKISQITAAATSDFQLYVAKGIRAEKVKVDAKANWPDYVFEPTYALRPLSEVELYINENKHLPNVPSALEIEAKGIDMAEMDATLLRKIEELTLYIIQQQKQITALAEVITSIKQENHDKKD